MIEPSLLEGCSGREKLKFFLTGLVVLINLFLIVAGSICFSSLLIHNWAAIVVNSLIIICCLVSIHQLLLTTVSSNRLPHTEGVSRPWLSLFVRFAFLLFMSFLIAKPIELVLFGERIKPYLTEFKEQQVINFYSTHLSYVDEEIEAMEEKAAQSDLTPEEGEMLNQHIAALCIDRIRYIENFRRVNARSNYLSAQVLILHREMPWIWGLTLLITGLIFTPFVVKLMGVTKGQYQLNCDNVDYELIVRQFLTFRSKYQAIFRSHYQIEASLYEEFHDPPFNTRKKTDERTCLGLDDLLLRIESIPPNL